MSTGNSVLPQSLLNASGAQLHIKTTVSLVTRLDNGKFQLRADPVVNATEYDYVVLAAPHEVCSVSSALVARSINSCDFILKRL